MHLRRLGAFGLEADRIDPDFGKVREALFAGQVLVFRARSLQPAQYLAFARQFGRPEPHRIDQFHHPELADILIPCSRMRDALKDTMIMLLPVLAVLAQAVTWPSLSLFLPRLFPPGVL